MDFQCSSPFISILNCVFPMATLIFTSVKGYQTIVQVLLSRYCHLKSYKVELSSFFSPDPQISISISIVCHKYRFLHYKILMRKLNTLQPVCGFSQILNLIFGRSRIFGTKTEYRMLTNYSLDL